MDKWMDAVEGLAIVQKGRWSCRHMILVGMLILVWVPGALPAEPVSEQDLNQRAHEQRISVRFEDMDLRAAIQLLASELGLELMLDENVDGRLNLVADDVAPGELMAGLLRNHQLGYRISQGVIHVAPGAVLLAQAQEAAAVAEAMAPLLTKYLQINYADATVILDLVGGGDAGGLLSQRGVVSVDARTNTLIVRDIESRLDDIDALLQVLDVPVRQVLIETRIVSASTETGRELGARWGFNTDAFALNQDSLPDTGITLAADHRTASSMGASLLRHSRLLELELTALENAGQAELIARPRVTTQDNTAASIQSGVRIPYQAQAGGTAGGSITQFVDAVLALEVTPLITPDGRIIMQLSIRQDSVASGSGDVPAINTNTVNTRVLVDNGDTLVLGGIFRDEQTREEIATPVLGNVPILGRLFRRSQQAARRTELLIFITPQIVPLQ